MSSGLYVTVLIPCHSIQYLEMSVQSIKDQTLDKTSFEVLLIADRVEIAEVAKVLNGLQVNYRIIKSCTPGIVPALNLGLHHANSKYVARMDEDDVMMPRRLEIQLKYLEKNQSVLAVGGQLQFIDQAGEPIGNARFKKRIRMNEADLLKNSPLAHPATMFRLESVRSVGGYRDFLPEDWDLWIRLRELGQIENLSATVLKYRIHSKQLSREKMYAQNLAKPYVATSYFARKAKIIDHPHGEETPSEWLQNTQKHLRVISKAYIKFEKNNKKSETINSILELKTTGKKIYKTLQVGQQFPLALFQFILSKLLAKFRQIFQ